MAELLIHQIIWKPAQREGLEAGYAVLDNTGNERPDWYEYWPIRRFWLSNDSPWAQAFARGELEDDYFGFFSPKFPSKTLLNFAQMSAQMQAGMAKKADVVVFSPQPDMAAFYLNVFEQQEAFDAGFLELSETFLRAAGRPQNLRTLVMDSQTTVFSNYFVAKGWFWREWLHLTEMLFDWAENPTEDWHHRLSQPTHYTHGAQTKVFLMERITSLLLVSLPQRPVVHAANPWPMAWSMSRLREFPTEAVMSDALKIAMRQHGWAAYSAAFNTLRGQVLSRLACPR